VLGRWNVGRRSFTYAQLQSREALRSPQTSEWQCLSYSSYVCGNPSPTFPHSHSHFLTLMSSSTSHPIVSFSSFQDLVDAALSQYSQKTGKDIATDPLTARLLPCHSSDAVLSILQEQAHAFNQYRNGDWKIQLMRRLKPTVDILLALSTSGVFGEGIGPVRLTISIHVSWSFTIHPSELSTSESDLCRSWSPTRSVYPSTPHLCLYS
jgi:hypothetical protein